ncbi:MAG: glycosyltransferase [Anaerolineae bacterium]
MMRLLLSLASGFAASILLLFTARRWLFILSALLPGGRPPPRAEADLPPVLLLVPVRNEAAELPDLLAALDRLDYPARRLQVVLIDDGSTDGGGQILAQWAGPRPNWQTLSLAQNRGKARALNAALARFPEGEIVAVFDADERPEPGALQHLVRPFASPTVGGVSGRRAASNPLASPAASYTAFEGLVHQLITMRAKDRLKLAPALLGANCAYRRSALAGAGNFKPGALLEDSDLTVRLARAGWDIRFEPRAVSYHRLPRTVGGYWRQHRRWARGFNEVAREQAGPTLTDRRLSPALRLELLAFSLGYLDRLALLGGAVLALLHRRSRRLLGRAIALSLLTPFCQTLAALAVDRAPPVMWARVVWLPVFFGLDLAMAASGLWGTLRGTPQTWEERRSRG